MSMTTLLTSKQTDALRSIGDSAFVLFALWMIDSNFPGRMTTADELKPYLHPTIKDKRKIEAQLNALCASGRVTQTSAGYVLLEGGRALLLGMTGVNETKDLALSSPASAVAGTLTAQALTEIIDADEISSANSSESDARNLRASLLKKKREEEEFFYKNKSSSSDSSELKSAQISQNLRIGNEISHTFATLKVGESAILPVVTGYTFEDGTPVYQMDRGDGVLITTRDILDAVEVIEWFGTFSPGLPVGAIKPELALAWIAKGCDDHEDLHREPVRTVYNRLRDKSNPPLKYFKNPTQYLPDEYCAELGLIKYDCKSCVDAKFSTRAALEEHVQKMHVLPEAEIEETQTMDALDSDDAGSKAWASVLNALQMEMPRASFDTWVRYTCAVYYDGTALSVGVRNQYARDWLESRLTDTVERLLLEILNQPVSISFVVAEVSDD